MTTPRILFRPADQQDADATADIARRSRQHFLPYLPDLHSPEGDRKFFRRVVFSECTIWVVQSDADIVGFCAFRDGWVDHLYLLPGHVGHGHGATLLNRAKQGQMRLQLWVFQQNARAIGFYERHGFRRIRETDGAGNEEKTPDALYEWCAET